MKRKQAVPVDSFQSRDETAILVHKTIANYGSRFAFEQFSMSAESNWRIALVFALDYNRVKFPKESFL